MKKIFTLFAAALVGLCAYAQMPETCPSELSFQLLNGEDPAQVEVELMLTNCSENLNGFNIEVEKSNDAVQWKKVSRNYFTAKGYANVILARLDDGTPEEELEDILNELCDIKNNVKDGNLVMIELLSTLDCRFFPVLAEPTAIGKFFMDWSAVDEGEGMCLLLAPTEPERYSFSYTGGVEGTRAWSPDEPAVLWLEKHGDFVSGLPTAIRTISTEKGVDNRIFDLQGRELQSVPEHGIYIQNGKKFVK